ncbi:ABC transporter permease [Rhizobium sp. C4]|uniref:ABC transporter permease n=1 Tax=Rhizobium sp. C4 TaxID=1349800 RepID=UPI001E3FBC1C|nr:ABC transporter permease [Rhizobium sp. C4]MCD2174305.1 ABC transporter permease [Rhizobium sp. C4]
MRTGTYTDAGRKRRSGLDRLGAVLVVIAAAGLVFQPFSLVRPNRIVAAKPVALLSALPPLEAGLVLAVVIAACAVLLFRTGPALRLGVSVLTLAVLAMAIGRAGVYLTPTANSYARVAPGGAFWMMAFAFSIVLADASARLRLTPLSRLGLLALIAGAVGLLLYSGAWDSLSILREYANRADVFWREARVHLLLAVGSLAAAALVGIPLGILCFRVRPLRAALLNSLNILQTIPSMALFGLLIAPLAWVGAHVPGASAIGIAGIGVAPAFVALFAYSLLPMVSNTVAGLESVPPQARDAARGMGMTARQRFFEVDMPLAFPVVLTGIRIVLVQNLGLAVLAGLIGGGGFGTFVFQGISQTATDLVLLGALPTVALAFAAAIVLDALVEIANPTPARSPEA